MYSSEAISSGILFQVKVKFFTFHFLPLTYIFERLCPLFGPNELFTDQFVYVEKSQINYGYLIYPNSLIY